MRIRVIVGIALIPVLVVVLVVEHAPNQDASISAVDGASPDSGAHGLTWMLQSLAPSEVRYFQTVLRFASRVDEISGGRLHIDVYPTGAIVKAGREFYGVHTGIIDACLAGHFDQLDRYSAAGLFYQVIGGMSATQTQMWFLVGGGNELATRMYQSSNCHYVNTLQLHPPEIWCHSKVPLESKDDLKHLRFRVAGDAREVLSTMGANTITFPASDIYEYAVRGMVDAFEYGEPAINWDMSFQEIADYLYLSPSRAPTGGSALFVNRRAWQELPLDLQATIKCAAMVETQQWYAEQVLLNYGAIQRFADFGTSIAPLALEIEEEFLSTAQAYYDRKASADPFFAEVLNSQRAFKALCERHDVS